MRVLILHASIGFGHLSAARALESAFRKQGAEHVWVEDVLAYGPRLFGKLYAGSYMELAENLPELWAYYYKRTDQNERGLSKRLGEVLLRLGITGLDKLVQQCNPDVIMSTHFLPFDMLLSYRRKGSYTQPIYCVVTDYNGHAFWAYPDIDGYFVGSDETARLLAHHDVPESIITVTGIPVNPAIAEPKDLERIRQDFQFSNGPVLTLLGNGLNSEQVCHMVADMQERNIRGTLVVAAGRDTTLIDSLQDVTGNQQLHIRVLGMIDNLDDLIAVSALVIGKAGGLTVSEVMARHTPMLLVDPVPGQEEWNADHVVSMQAGVQVRLSAMVPVVVEQFLNNPGYLEVLRAGAERTGRPRAAEDIAKAVRERVQQQPS